MGRWDGRYKAAQHTAECSGAAPGQQAHSFQWGSRWRPLHVSPPNHQNHKQHRTTSNRNNHTQQDTCFWVHHTQQTLHIFATGCYAVASPGGGWLVPGALLLRLRFKVPLLLRCRVTLRWGP